MCVRSCGGLKPDPCNCPMEDPTWNVWIGGDPHYRRFHGCIDEVKVFDAALTAEEVGAASSRARDRASPCSCVAKC